MSLLRYLCIYISRTHELGLEGMSVFAQVYIYIHAYIYICIYINMYIDICIQIYRYMYGYMYICTCVCVCVCVCMCIYTHICQESAPTVLEKDESFKGLRV